MNSNLKIIQKFELSFLLKLMILCRKNCINISKKTIISKYYIFRNYSLLHNQVKNILKIAIKKTQMY